MEGLEILKKKEKLAKAIKKEKNREGSYLLRAKKYKEIGKIISVHSKHIIYVD